MNLDLICKDSGSSSLYFGLMDKANPDFLGSGVLSLLLRESKAEQAIHMGEHLRASTERARVKWDA